MADKEKYRKYCRSDSSIPVFAKDWWLDAACGESNWDVALIENNGEIVASFPYYIKRRFGIKAITMPWLTQNAGIRIKYPRGQKEECRIAYEKELIYKLLDRLPNFPIFRQNFHYSFTDWQPLCWKGFRETTCYTYVIDDLTNLDAVFDGFSKTAKKNIRKAQKTFEVYSNESIEDFYRIHKKVFERQGINYPYSLDFLKRLDAACSENNSRRILYARDGTGKVYSAVYIVWDSESAYLLMSGSEIELRGYNGKTLLVWEAIRFASTVTQKFDFEGSMIERIAEYNRQFGAVPKPYYYIFKEHPLISGLAGLFNRLTHIIKGGKSHDGQNIYREQGICSPDPVRI
ncbi:MAG TPA: methicillin resistance protein [Ruminiclostridium sp.]|nr:methicillin resistance protein [Ruminiclostridium sp.]